MEVKKAVRKTLRGTKKVVLATTNFVGITAKIETSRYEYPVHKFFLWFILYFFMSVLSLFLLLPLAYYLYSKKRVY